jgi:hypothetical protein
MNIGQSRILPMNSEPSAEGAWYRMGRAVICPLLCREDGAADSPVLRELSGAGLKRDARRITRPFRECAGSGMGDSSSDVPVSSGVAGREGSAEGEAIAVDATTLEANAAPRWIVQRDTGEDGGSLKIHNK